VHLADVVEEGAELDALDLLGRTPTPGDRHRVLRRRARCGRA
jgi:hypothetical protein